MRLASLCFVLALSACSQPSADPMAVEAPEDSWFTVLVIPDTQYLTLNPQYPILRDMMTWILDNHEALNIAMVLQEGDITHNNTEAEWVEADAAFGMLDGVVPYAVCVGNHDMEGVRDTSRFNAWFGLERLQQSTTYFESASETSADDHAHIFTAGGVEWMVVSFAYDPTDEALAWGAQLVASHPEHHVIVLTHAYLTPGANTAGEGRGIEEQVVDPHPNVEFVLNGHFIGGTNAQRRRERADGSEVVEVFANYQDMTLAGMGRMRQMRIDPEAGTLDVTTCNAFDVCSDDEGDAFSLDGLDFGF